MTKLHFVMDWASQITSRDVLTFSSWIDVIHNVFRPSKIGVKPSEPSPKPKICDESDRHGLTCHITCRDDLADDVAIMWQMTWRWCLKTWHWRGSHMALTWHPSGADVAATRRWRGWHVALTWLPCGADVAATWCWREHMQFFARLNFSLYQSITAQPTYISGTTHIHFSPTNAQQI
jgi:hypothetical protein